MTPRADPAALLTALEHVSEAIEITTADGTIYYVNRAWQAIAGYTAAEAVGRTPAQLLRSDVHPPAFYAAAMAALEGGQVWRDHLVSRRKDGSLFEQDVTVTPLMGPDGRLEHIVGVRRDVTEESRRRRAMEESEERLKLAALGARDGLWDWDITLGSFHVSGRWLAMIGEPADAPTSLDKWHGRIHPEDSGSVHSAIARHLEGLTPHLECEHRIRHADGTWRWVLVRGMAFRDPVGRPLRAAGSLTDITDRKAGEQMLFVAATHDALTGLPNRNLFMDRVEHAISRARRAGGGFALLYLDLRRFKAVNDTYGHSVGDQLLAAVAGRIAATIRAGDSAARLGGDEFAVLLERISSAAEAEAALRRLEQSLARPHALGEHTVTSPATIGLALGDGTSAVEELLRAADAAMYAARGATVSSTPPPASATRRSRLAEDLRRAVHGPAIRAVWQPIIDLEDGRMRGLEALARWRHPSLGEIGPGDFVPLAEDTGLAGAMAESFLERVLDQLQVWLTAGRIPARFPVNVNVSARQVHDPAFVPHITSVCRSGRAGTARLGIEITEATLDGRPEETSHVMWRLREAGVTLSLDDFGAGRAALHQLRSTPVDYLKIDRTLTAALTADPVSAEIVRGLVAVASALGVETIAEGVETAEQVRLLRALGCGLGQGFHLAPPVDPDEIRWAEAANAG